MVDRIPLRAQARPAQPGAARDVIVILRDQLDGNPPVRRAMQGRSAALAAAQNAVFARMPANTSRRKTQFRMINAFATSATQAEEEQLAQDPDVLAVVPDRVVRVVTPAAQAAMPALANSVTPASAAAQLCNTLEPEALQLTHTAYLDPSIPQAQQVRDGNGELVTGRGVKVAFLADSLDPNLPGFTHTDGTPVFIDYQDFSGNAPNEPSDSREAFLDASSIAAQDTPGGTPLTFDISAYTNTPPVPSPCNIRIRGMAPGASLVGLNVQSSYLNALSSFVRAIEYAVVVDDVDVISESFVTNMYPDQTIDPISLANKAAVQAGVTVVALTGDAGAGGTIGSPGSDPEVIEVGATTQLRSYAQTGRSAISISAGGYVSNNIAPFSSSGFTQKTGRTIDVVAPGDLGWALCSTNTALFTGCRTLSTPGMPSPIQLNGGTSESAPFVAGEVALVIQAYRSTHGGKSPDPSLVKRIIMSTATDLGAPPEQQGAGLINALAAVYAALASNGEHGPAAHPPDANNSLLVTAEPGSFALTDDPGEAQSLRITLTNLGSIPQSLSPTLQSLNQKIASDSGVISIDTTIQNFTQQSIVVPANADNLSVSISFPMTIGSPSNPLVFLALIDASGRLVADSRPQTTNSGFMHVEAVRPAAGTWTAVAYTPPEGFVGSYAGPIRFGWRADRMRSIGTVSPAHLTLAPGASAKLTAAFSMPESPGDSAAVLRLNAIGSAAESDPAVPISLRTLVPVSPQGATFSGTLTGGNSRFGIGPTQFYSFDVPRGVKNMNLILDVLGDGHLVQGILVDPHGLPYSFNSNEDPFTGAPTTSIQLNRYEPTPGRWQFSLTDYFTTSGLQTETPFSATLAFNAVRVTADGLPNSDRIALSASGAPLEVPIVVTNNSRTTQMYFVDARRSTSVSMQLPVFSACGNPPMLPLACFFSYVPPQATSLAFAAQSTVPVSMTAWDYAGTLTSGTNTFSSMILGRPDKTGTTTATLSASEIPYSTWFIQPAPIGPSGPSGPPTDPVSLSATAIARDFDTAMIADSGNAWMDIVQLTATYNPLILAPGESGVIRLFIQPDPARIGKTVSGDVFIDTFNFVQFNGDELARIPYRYRVVR